MFSCLAKQQSSATVSKKKYKNNNNQHKQLYPLQYKYEFHIINRYNNEA